jgi:hypothetical protein
LHKDFKSAISWVEEVAQDLAAKHLIKTKTGIIAPGSAAGIPLTLPFFSLSKLLVWSGRERGRDIHVIAWAVYSVHVLEYIKDL